MASRGDIEAGKAFITLYVKNSLLVKGLNAIGTQVKSVGSQIMGIGTRVTALGTMVVGALGGAVKIFADMGSELADVSARTGVAVDNLAELKFAAEQTGGSFEDVEKALLAMEKKGFNPKGFDAIAKQIAAIEDPAKRTEKAMEIFGKSGAKLIPLMGNLAELRKQAQDLGLVPTDQAVADADTIGDLFDQIASVGKAAIFEIGAALSPVLIPALETIRSIAVTTTRWVRENGELVQTIAKIGIGILIAGAAISVIGAAITGIGAVFTGVAAIVGTIGAIIGALLSPIGLITAAIVGGLIAWVNFTESGRQAASNMAKWFTDLGDTFGETWGGIVDAVMAGDLELAGKVALAGLMVAWTTTVQAINKLWQDAKWWFMAVWQEATAYLGTIFINVWAGMQSGFVSTVAAMQSTWGEFTRFLADTQTSVEGRTDTYQADIAEAMGFITSEEADLAREAIANRTDKEIGDRDAKNVADQKAIEDAKNAELANIERNRVGANANLEQDKQRQRDALNAQYKADLAAAQADVDAAKKELNNVRGQAKDKAAGAGRFAPGAPQRDISDFSFAPKNSFTTFSGAALSAVGNGGAQQAMLAQARAAAEQERQLAAEQARRDERLRQAVMNNQLQVVA